MGLTHLAPEHVVGVTVFSVCFGKANDECALRRV